MPWIVLLAASYLAKRRLLAKWAAAEREGAPQMSYREASLLVGGSVPWDLTFGLLGKRNVLFGGRPRS